MCVLQNNCTTFPPINIDIFGVATHRLRNAALTHTGVVFTLTEAGAEQGELCGDAEVRWTKGVMGGTKHLWVCVRACVSLCVCPAPNELALCHGIWTQMWPGSSINNLINRGGLCNLLSCQGFSELYGSPSLPQQAKILRETVWKDALKPCWLISNFVYLFIFENRCCLK